MYSRSCIGAWMSAIPVLRLPCTVQVPVPICNKQSAIGHSPSRLLRSARIHLPPPLIRSRDFATQVQISILLLKVFCLLLKWIQSSSCETPSKATMVSENRSILIKVPVIVSLVVGPVFIVTRLWIRLAITKFFGIDDWMILGSMVSPSYLSSCSYLLKAD